MEAVFFDGIIFVISLVVILWSGGFLVRALSRMAAFMELSEFFVSFVLVALATSLPELLIGIASGLAGTPELSFGNVIGSNILNMTLMLAVPAFIARSLIAGFVFARRDLVYMTIIVLLPILLLVDGTLSRIDGGILIAAFVWYLSRLWQQKEYFTRPLEEGPREKEETLKTFWRDVGLMVVGFALLIVASDFLVDSASIIAEGLGMPIALIGVLILGLGTNLPELAFGTHAVAQGHGGMVLGGILGSIVSNAGLIVGVTVLISPLVSSAVPLFAIEGVFLFITAIALSIIVRTGNRISVFEGIVLTAIYGIFAYIEIDLLLACVTC